MSFKPQFLLLMALLVTLPAMLAKAQEPDQEKSKPRLIDFVRDIKPIFENHCNQCHTEDSDDDMEPYLDDKDMTLNFINKGNAKDSLIYKLITTDNEDKIMPPIDNDYDAKPLSKEQIETVRLWIEQQAPWEGETGVLPDPETETQADEEPAEDDLWWEGFQVFGLFHPAVVHFPIALLCVSALFALGGLRGSFVAADVSYYSLWIGALSSVVAAAMGWAFTMEVGMNSTHWGNFENINSIENLSNNKFATHGVGGIVVAVLAMFVAIYAFFKRRSDNTARGWMWFTLVLAGVVGWVGHEGGELTYPGNYDKAWEFVDKIRGVEEDENADNKKDDDQKEKTQPASDDDKSNEKKNDSAKNESPNENVQVDDSDKDKDDKSKGGDPENKSPDGKE